MLTAIVNKQIKYISFTSHREASCRNFPILKLWEDLSLHRNFKQNLSNEKIDFVGGNTRNRHGSSR
jgi:hypothetical protein